MSRSTRALAGAVTAALAGALLAAPGAHAEAIVYETQDVKAEKPGEYLAHAAIDIPTGYTRDRVSWHEVAWHEGTASCCCAVAGWRSSDDSARTTT